MSRAIRSTCSILSTARRRLLHRTRYVSGGRWSYPFHPYIDSGADLTTVFYRVTGDDALGTFQGTLVSAKWRGSEQEKREEVSSLAAGPAECRTTFLDADLTDADGTPLPAGTYTFTFFGVAETGNGLGGGPPFRLAAVRDDIHDELDRIRERLHRLEKQNGDTKELARKSGWLELRIAVLKVRLQYPTDEVLQQLELRVEARKSLGRKKHQKFLHQLNTRLAELQAGG